uniref:Cleavage and polyadenylation specificity factor subunit 6 n=1 Tax=Angiostrongylus cantonensis TaxID=6313 RepID=A0A0K0DGK0_ANGCA
MTEIDSQAELDLLGEGPAATDGDHLDDHLKVEELKSEEVDLYDDAIAPSSGEKPIAPAPVRNTQPNGSTGHASDGKYCCYIGNLVWWATDADVAAIGITDLIDMKFFENRTNGQSKGFALLVFASDTSVRTVTDQMPQRQIHGQSPVILPYTKASLNRLDEATSKMQSRPDPKQAKKDEACMNMGTIRIGAAPTGPSGPPPMLGPRMGPSGPMGSPGGPPMNIAASGQMVASASGPVGPGGLMNRGPVMMGQPVNQVFHVELALLSNIPRDIINCKVLLNIQMFPGVQFYGSLLNCEFRTVASSAISRAVADAAGGDVKSATETILTAISLIKQSRVAHDDRCRLLVASLQVSRLQYKKDLNKETPTTRVTR